jgi:hypothetical protein
MCTNLDLHSACVCKTYVPLSVCLCDVIATDVENAWLVNFKILIIQNFYYNTFLFIQIQKLNYSTNNSTQIVTLLHLWFYTVL